VTPLIVHLIDANADTRYFRAIVAHSRTDRFRVAVGSLAPAGPLQEAMTRLGAGTFDLGASTGRQYPLALPRLVRFLRRERASLLHAHCFYPTLLGLVAARLARVRFVFTRHHSDHNIRLGKRWHTRVDAMCARRADRVIAVSEATARVMIDVERVSPSRVVVVYNGMDPLPEADPGSAAALRLQLGIAPQEPVCLMLGRLHEEKGQFVLLAALADVRLQKRGIRVLFVGDGPHRSSMEEAARGLGLENVVSFLGPRTDVPVLMAAADVVVVPSLAESFGFVALEAMALGRPVVAAATGGLTELIDDGRTGLLVSPGDPVALAAGISRLLANPPLAAALGASGHTDSQAFTAERMVHAYEDVYAGVLDE
jgi:glycosyltransferase involved in cell wall biosynthesis